MRVCYMILALCAIGIGIWLLPNASAQLDFNQDASGNERDMVCVGDNPVTSPQPKYGDGQDFGLTRCIRDNTDMRLLNDLTIFVAAVHDSTSSHSQPAVSYGRDADSAYQFGISGASQDNIRMSGLGTTCSSTTNIATGAIRFAATRTRIDSTHSTIRIYRNGVLDTTCTNLLESSISPDFAFMMGCQGASSDLDSCTPPSSDIWEDGIHEVRIWDSVIPLATLQSLMDPNDNEFNGTAVGTEYALYFLEPAPLPPPPGGGDWIESDLIQTPPVGFNYFDVHTNYQNTSLVWTTLDGVNNGRIARYSNSLALQQNTVICATTGFSGLEASPIGVTYDNRPIVQCKNTANNYALAMYNDLGQLTDLSTCNECPAGFPLTDTKGLTARTGNQIIFSSLSSSTVGRMDITGQASITETRNGLITQSDIDDSGDNNWTAFSAWDGDIGGVTFNGVFVRSVPGGSTISSIQDQEYIGAAIHGNNVWALPRDLGTGTEIIRYDINPGGSLLLNVTGGDIDNSGGGLLPSLVLSKDGNYLLALSTTEDFVRLFHAGNLTQIGVMNVTDPISADVDYLNNNVFVTTTEFLYRFPIGTFTDPPPGINPFNADETQNVGQLEPEIPGDSVSNIFDDTVQFISTSWGISVAATGALLTLAILGFMFYWFSQVSEAPIVLGVVGFIGVTASFFLGLIPLFVLFIVGFLILAFVTLVFFSARGDDSE